LPDFALEAYSVYSQSSLSLAGPSISPSTALPPSPPANFSIPKKARKTSRARAQPQPVAEFTLDTNLDEMDGIIARPGPQYPPWHEDASDSSHLGHGGGNIVGPTGMTGVQSPTAAFFTDPFSGSAFPLASPGSAASAVAPRIPEPPLQANGHRPGSPTAGVGPSTGIGGCPRLLSFRRLINYSNPNSFLALAFSYRTLALVSIITLQYNATTPLFPPSQNSSKYPLANPPPLRLGRARIMGRRRNRSKRRRLQLRVRRRSGHVRCNYCPRGQHLGEHQHAKIWEAPWQRWIWSA
jgi:hypothetical protein